MCRHASLLTLLLSFFAAGSVAAQDFSFEAIAPSEVFYNPEVGTASFSVDVIVVETDGSTATDGLSVSLEYDPNLLEATALTLGSDFTTLNGGTGPAFSDFTLDATGGAGTGVVLGLIYDFSFLETLTFDEDATIATIDFQTVSGGLVGDTDGATTVLDFDSVGTPAQPNIIAAGISEITPTLIDAIVDLTPQLPFEYALSTAGEFAVYDANTGNGAFSLTLSIEEIGAPEVSKGLAVDGFSASFTYDSSLITATGGSYLGDVAALDSGAGPEFESISVSTPGVVTVATIFDFAFLETVLFDVAKPAVEIDFETVPGPLAGDDEGVLLSFVFESSGSPAIDNVVSTSGGGFRVAAPTANVGLFPTIFSYRFTGIGTGVAYRPSTGEGSGSATLTIEERELDSPNFPIATSGFTASLTYDDALVSIDAVVPMAELNGLNMDAGPDFFDANTAAGDGNGITIAAIYDFDFTETITFDVEKPAARIDFSTVPAALTGDNDGAAFDLAFGAIDLASNIVAGETGEELNVATLDQTVNLIPAIYTYSLVTTAAPGTLSADLAITEEAAESASFPTATQGFSASIAYDSALITATGVTAINDLAAVNAGAGPDFINLDATATGAGMTTGLTLAVIYDFDFADTITYDVTREVATIDFTVVADGTADLDFVSLGDPAVDNLVAGTDNSENLAIGVGASVEVTAGGGDGPFFIRGDADGNGVVFAILDALYVLEFGFTGGPAPVCENAADADNNGVVFPILDALYILEFGFTGGPAPGAPFPDCGEDDDATLTCDVSTCTP